MTPEFGALAFAGLAALGVPAILRPILHALGVVDLPNERSSHSRVTLRGGGVAPLPGVLIGGLWVALAVPVDESLMALLVLTAGVAMGVVGLVEDVGGLRASIRAGLQALIGGVLIVTLCAAAGGGWIWLPLAVLFFAANVNFTNFMDGINAISGLHGLVVGLAFSILGMLQGFEWLVFVGFIIAVVFTVFLPWNLAPPGMFLGDVGSYLLGGLVAATAMAALFAGLNPVAVLAPLAVYWADTVSTLARRLARGEQIFQAHRTHAYQRLTNTGLSHCKSAAIVAAFTLLTSAVGILVQAEVLAWPLGMLLIPGLAVTYLSLPRLRGDVLSKKVHPEDRGLVNPAREVLDV